MNRIILQQPALHQDATPKISTKIRLAVRLICLVVLFLWSGPILQFIDATASVLDIGILSLLFFGLLLGVTVLFCSLWLLEILWKPFFYFRQHFDKHFNQLTSWQQCILYFSVFFLSLYGCLWALAIVL